MSTSTFDPSEFNTGERLEFLEDVSDVDHDFKKGEILTVVTIGYRELTESLQSTLELGFGILCMDEAFEVLLISTTFLVEQLTQHRVVFRREPPISDTGRAIVEASVAYADCSDGLIAGRVSGTACQDRYHAWYEAVQTHKRRLEAANARATEGQGIVEYALIACLIGIAIVSLLFTFGVEDDVWQWLRDFQS